MVGMGCMGGRDGVQGGPKDSYYTPPQPAAVKSFGPWELSNKCKSKFLEPIHGRNDHRQAIGPIKDGGGE